MKKSHRQNHTPGSVKREQQEVQLDGWGSVDYSTPSEGSNLSGANNNEIDSLVLDLFQEPANFLEIILR